MIERAAELGREQGLEGDVQLWTLTVDQSRYASPRDAWADVGAKRRVGEAMRAMGLRWYVVVLEWHESGWPHWHVLVWEPKERMRVDHAAMTRAWGIGHTLYRCRWRDKNGQWSGKPKPIAWAVLYITKYLTKGGGAPAWVGDLSHVRMIWASRAWGPVVRAGSIGSEVSHADEALAEELGDDELGLGLADEPLAADDSRWRPNRVAVDQCGQAVRLIRERVTESGEVRWDYLGQAPVAFKFARKLYERVCGRAGGRCRSLSCLKLLENSESWERVKATLLPAGRRTVPLIL